MNLDGKTTHVSLIDSIKETTTTGTETIASFFGLDTKPRSSTFRKDLDDSAPREYHYFDDKTEAEDNQMDFTVNTSFFMQSMTVLENSPLPEPEVRLAYTSTKNFLIGCLMLFLMVGPCSIIGPMTISLPAKNVFVQASWRFQGCTLLAIPLMLALYAYKGQEMSITKDFAPKVMLRSMMNSFLIFLWNLGFILGCSLTITSHADIMYSSGGVYLLIIAIVTCKVVHRLEYMGYLLYALGVYMMFSDPSATKAGMDGQSYVGDLYAFLGAGCCAAFNILNEGKMESLHPMVTLTQNFLFASLFQLLLFPIFVGPAVFFSFDPVMGAFGWLMNFEASILLMFVVAPITGILGNFGFYSAYYYFPMEIVAGTMLIEPFFAQVVGVMMGQDEIPGIKTVVGCTVITVGFIVAGFGSKFKENQEKRHQNIKKIDDDEEECVYQRID
jgi:drug/metabolite transporter (DMT)-like permease